MVLDASVVLDLSLGRIATGSAERIWRGGEGLHAPHLLDIEVLQALRRLQRRGDVTAKQAGAALRDLEDFPIERHEHELLRGRIWELRHMLTAYDAAYLALAEQLSCALFTRDRGLAGCPLARTTVEFI